MKINFNEGNNESYVKKKKLNFSLTENSWMEDSHKSAINVVPVFQSLCSFQARAFEKKNIFRLFLRGNIRNAIGRLYKYYTNQRSTVYITMLLIIAM